MTSVRGKLGDGRRCQHGGRHVYFAWVVKRESIDVDYLTSDYFVGDELKKNSKAYTVDLCSRA